MLLGPNLTGLYVIGLTIIVLLSGLIVSQTVNHREDRARSRLLKAGVACLLADLDDHRHTNQGAHNTLADHLGVQIIQPDVIPLTSSQAQLLKSYCQQFVRLR